jgi:hypothetical protein
MTRIDINIYFTDIKNFCRGVLKVPENKKTDFKKMFGT